MADAYRGLTIRFGGDTTALTKALTIANRAIGNTERNIRTLNKALKLDPGNQAAISQRMDLISERAQEAALKVRTLNEALEQNAGNRLLTTGERLEDVANRTKDARIQVQLLNDSFVNTTGKLEVLKEKMQAAYASMQTKGMFHGADSDLFALDSGRFKRVIDVMQALRPAMAGVGEQYERLVTLHKRFQSELMDMEEIEGFQKLKAEIALATAEVKNFARQWASAVLESSTKVDSFGSKFKNVDTVLEATRSRMQRMKAISDSLPEGVDELKASIDASEAHFEALEDAVKGVNGNISVLESRIKGTAAEGKSLAQIADGLDRANAVLVESKMRFDVVQTEIDETERELRRLKAQPVMDKEAIKAAETKLKSLRQTIRPLQTMLDKAKAHAEAFANAMKLAGEKDKYAELLAELKKLGIQIDADKRKLDELGNAGKRAGDKTAGGLDKAGNAAKRSLNGISGALQSMGSALMGTMSMYISQFFFRAVSSAEQFDEAYRSMMKTVNGTEEQFVALREAAIEFGNTHAISADTILNIEAMGGQLGIAVDKLEEFATVAANLEISTNLSAEQISEEMGQLSGIIGEASFDFEKFGDALTRLGNNAPVLESNVMQVNSRIASMGNLMDFTVPQMLAWSTAVAATGQGAEAAGTALSKTFSDIESAVGSGGEKLEGFARIAGMTSDEFRTAWGSDASGTLQRFIVGLSNMKRNGESADNALRGLGITSVRQKQALLGLTNTVSGLDKYLMLADDAWNGMATTMADGTIIEAGDAAREAERKAAGFAGAIQMLRNNASAFMSTFSEAMTPAVRGLTSFIHSIEEVFKRIGGVGQGAVVGITIALAALGPVLRMVGGFLLAHEKILDRFGTATDLAGNKCTAFGAKIQALGARITGISKISALASGAILSIGIAFAATMAMIVVAEWKKHQERVELLRKSTEGLRDATSGLAEKLSGENTEIKNIAVSARDSRNALNEVRQANADLADSINETTKNAGANVYALEMARESIETLAGKSNLTTEEQGRLAAAVALVNDECGTQFEVTDALNGVIEDQNGAIDDICGAIDNYIDKRQQMIKIDALAGIAQDFETTIANARMGLNQATDAYNAIAAEWRAAGYGEIEQFLDPAYDISQLSSYQQSMIAQARSLIDDIDGYNQQIDEAEAAAAEVYRQMGYEYAAANGLADDLTDFINSKKDAIEGLLSANHQTIDSFQQSLQAIGMSNDALANIGDEGLNALAENFNGSIMSILNQLSEFDQNMLDEGTRALVSFATGMSEGTQNTVDAALLASGVTIDQFMTSVKENFPSAGDTAIQYFAMALENNKDLATASIEDITAAIEVELAPLADQFGVSGGEAMDAFTDAILSGKAPEDAAEIARQVTENLSVDATESGKSVSETHADGISDGQGAITNASKKAAGIFGEIAVAQGNASYTWGKHIVDNFALGMRSNGQAILNASTWMAETIKAYIGHTVPETGPLHDDDVWGLHFVENIVGGMEKGMPKLNKSMGKVTGVLEQALPSNFDYSAAYGVDIVANVPGTVYDMQVDAQEQANLVLAQTLIGWLDANLGPTIADYTPTATSREMGRMVRRVY